MKLRTHNKNDDRRRLCRYFCIYSRYFQRHAFFTFNWCTQRVHSGPDVLFPHSFHTLSTSIPCPCSLFQHMLQKCGENLIWLRLFCMLFFYCHLLFLFSFPSVFPLNTICCMAVFFTRAHKTHFICCFVFGKFGAKHLLLVIKIWTYILASTFNIGKDTL